MSLLVDAARALEGMKAHSMPSAHRLVWLMYAQHANDHDRAWPSLALLHDETGYGRTKLAEVIIDLVEHGYLVPDGNVGEGLRRSARYVVRIEGTPWPEDSRASLARSVDVARASRRANVKPLAARETSDPPGEQAVSRPANVSRLAARQSASRPASTNLPGTHQINPPDQPPITPARARAGDHGQTTIAFGPSPGTTTTPPAPTAEEAQQKAFKGPKRPKARASDGYADAWVQGNEDAGCRVSRPTASGVACLGRAAATHARYRDGEPITGDDLLKWLRVKARKFREGVEDPSKQRGGMTPFGFLQWLDDDPDTRAQPWRRPEERAAEAQRKAAPPEPLPKYTLADQELQLKFKRRLMGLPDLPPEELTAAAEVALVEREKQRAAAIAAREAMGMPAHG